MRSPEIIRVLALSGGVGGAKLVHGLAAVLPPEHLTVIVNTGDDFVHWGLTVCPDLDTVMYTLAGLADQTRGWGLAGETFAALSMVKRYGGASWFQLGDRDLGTHLMRTRALAEGRRLTQVTESLCHALGVGPRIVPMADEPRATCIDTRELGTLGFQEWFVRERCAPAIERIWFRGTTAPAPEVLAAIDRADVVILCPSNPYVSLDPILTLDGVSRALVAKPVIAVSPIVAGSAVKGPLADMIRRLAQKTPSAAAVMEHYRDSYPGLLDAAVVERGDDVAMSLVLATGTVMSTVADRAALARDILAFAGTLL